MAATSRTPYLVGAALLGLLGLTAGATFVPLGPAGLAVADAGFELVRAHPFKEAEGHGFIGSQKEGMCVFYNLDPTAKHTTHIDKAAGGDGRDYWDSWVEKAKTDPSAAETVICYHSRPADELYDLTADPSELKNLAAAPEHAGRLKALRTDLDAWMKDLGDEGLKTERALPDPRPKKKDKP